MTASDVLVSVGAPSRPTWLSSPARSLATGNATALTCCTRIPDSQN
ncbi:hypothetical protein [Streptomyces pseudoechinosporeus]